MANLAQTVLRMPGLRPALRRTSDWVDLQWSYVITVLTRLAPRARGRLLDVGCGDRPYEHLFRPHVSEYIGIEHEDTFVATSASSRGRPDLVYDGKRLPFPDGSFDTVMNIQVLEHTPRPAELVAEMARVLAPDGLLILSAPFSFRLHEEPNDFFRYTPHGLRELCGRVGLVLDDQIETYGNLWSVIGHKLNSFLAFRVANIGALAQDMGKLGHETSTDAAPRLWTLPFVGPAMLAIAAGARVLDRALPDPTESLGFVVIARRAR